MKLFFSSKTFLKNAGKKDEDIFLGFESLKEIKAKYILRNQYKKAGAYPWVKTIKIAVNASWKK